MFRVFLLYCALFLFLTVAVPLASAQAGGAHPASAEWTKGYTLILVDASTKAELAEARRPLAPATPIHGSPLICSTTSRRAAPPAASRRKPISQRSQKRISRA